MFLVLCCAGVEIGDGDDGEVKTKEDVT